MWQTIFVVVMVVSALAYLARYYVKGRKEHGDCPDCPAKERIAKAQRRSKV
jgi:hypothetical protein